MKKIFSLSASLIFFGASVVATTLTDVTPIRYKFADRTEGTYAVDYMIKGSNPENQWETAGTESNYTDNGFIAFHAGPPATGLLADSPEGIGLQEGVNIVDLGGEVGKVLVIKGQTATDNYTGTYASLLAKGAEVGTGFPAWATWWGLNLYVHPDLTPANSNVRVRMVYNIFHNNVTEETIVIDNHYPSSWINAAELVGTAAAKATKAFAFQTNGTYDMTKWVVREFDFKAADEGLPMRIKLEIGKHYHNAIIYIKEMSFTLNPEGDAVTESFLTYDPNKTGAVGLDAACKEKLRVVVGGGQIKILNAEVGEVIEVYTVTGQCVSTRQAKGADVIELAQGVYVVRAGERMNKVVVQ